MGNARLEHVSEQIREVLSTALAFEMRDPGLNGVTITRVRLSPDFQYADIRYVTYEDGQRAKAESSFDRAKGALRTKVAKQVRMKKVPVLRFHYDEDVSAERRIGEILEHIKLEDGDDLVT